MKAGQCIGLAGSSGHINGYGFSYGFRTEPDRYFDDLPIDDRIPAGNPVSVEEKITKDGNLYKVYYIGWDEDDTEHKGNHAAAVYVGAEYVYRLEESDEPPKPVVEREYTHCVNDGQVIMYW